MPAAILGCYPRLSLASYGRPPSFKNVTDVAQPSRPSDTATAARDANLLKSGTNPDAAGSVWRLPGRVPPASHFKFRVDAEYRVRPVCLQIARQRSISGSASSASITPVDHPSRTQARSPALHPRNPKNAAQNSQSSNFMAKRPPAAPTGGGGFATSTAADLSCDRAPSICESAPCRLAALYIWRN